MSGSEVRLQSETALNNTTRLTENENLDDFERLIKIAQQKQNIMLGSMKKR